MKFSEYYVHYLSLHQNRNCRRLHLMGMVTASCIFVYAFSISCWWLCGIAPLLVFPFAWAGHFLFEHNTPAAWRNPILAGLADLRMTWDICRGKLVL